MSYSRLPTLASETYFRFDPRRTRFNIHFLVLVLSKTIRRDRSVLWLLQWQLRSRNWYYTAQGLWVTHSLILLHGHKAYLEHSIPAQFLWSRHCYRAQTLQGQQDTHELHHNPAMFHRVSSYNVWSQAQYRSQSFRVLLTVYARIQGSAGSVGVFMTKLHYSDDMVHGNTHDTDMCRYS